MPINHSPPNQASVFRYLLRSTNLNLILLGLPQSIISVHNFRKTNYNTHFIPLRYRLTQPAKSLKASFICDQSFSRKTHHSVIHFSKSFHVMQHKGEERTYILRFGSHIDKLTKDAGIGIAIYDSSDGSTLWSGHHFIPIIDQNTSEIQRITSNLVDYMALADGLRILSALMTNQAAGMPSLTSRHIEIQTNNDVIAKHLSKEYRLNSKHLKYWYEKVSKLTKEDFDQVKVVMIKSDQISFVKEESKLAVKKQKSCESYMDVMKKITTVMPYCDQFLQDNNEINYQFIDSVENTMEKPIQSEIINDVCNKSLGKVFQFDGVSNGTSGNRQTCMPPLQEVMSTSLKNDGQLSRYDKANKEHIDSSEKIIEELNELPIEAPNTEISPDKVYILRFDGGARGNPGIAGSGMVLYDSEDGSEIWSGCQYLGNHRTNNEAEYMGLITGMKCTQSLGVRYIVVQGDSQLILRQIEGTYQVKSRTLKPYYEEARQLISHFKSFETCHIERAKNSRADDLANEAMDTKISRGFESLDY